MLVVNDVASVSKTLYKYFKSKNYKVAFYQPATNAQYSNKLVLTFLRLLLPISLLLKGRKDKSFYIHYATFAGYLLRTRKQLVVHCHGTDIRENLSNKYRNLTLSALQRANLIFYSTPDLAEYVPNELKSKSYFIPNPVDVDLFKPAKKEHEGINIFVLSKLDKTKGADKFLPLVEQLAKEKKVSRIFVMKHGNALPNKLPCHEKIQYLDRLTKSEMISLMQQQDIAIGQMQLGAIGMTELEALACGVPTIAFFKYNGIYEQPCPILNAETTTEAYSQMKLLLDNTELRQQTSKQSREWVCENHSIEIVGSKIENIFEKYKIEF